MKERTHSRTGLLMTEIILAVLFFAITAACCLKVFAGASHLSDRAEQLKLALNSTENLIQQLKGADGSAEIVWEFYPEESFTEDGAICFSKEGTPCSQDQADYLVKVTIEAAAAENSSVGKEVEIISQDVTGAEIYRLTTTLLTGEVYETKE